MWSICGMCLTYRRKRHSVCVVCMWYVCVVYMWYVCVVYMWYVCVVYMWYVLDLQEEEAQCLCGLYVVYA